MNIEAIDEHTSEDEMSVIFKIEHTDIAGTCFICDSDLEPVGDEIDGDEHRDTWACENCEILITFITSAKVHTYHEISSCRIEVEKM